MSSLIFGCSSCISRWLRICLTNNGNSSSRIRIVSRMMLTPQVQPALVMCDSPEWINGLSNPIHVARDGWGNTQTFVVFVAAVVLLSSFVFYEAKVVAHCGMTRDERGLAWDAAFGFLVEEFGQPMNLMLARSTALSLTFMARSRVESASLRAAV